MQAWENFSPELPPRYATPSSLLREQASWLDDFAAFHGPEGRPRRCQLAGVASELVLRRPATLGKRVASWPAPSGCTSSASSSFSAGGAPLKRYAQRTGHPADRRHPDFHLRDLRDVWAQPGLFNSYAQRAKVVAACSGHFSATGATLGNPLYDWAALQKTAYAWWAARLRATLGRSI